METKEKFLCLKCGHSWNPNFNKIPVACPKCKRYDWNKKLEVKK